MSFKALHQQNKPLLLCNVWDAISTKIAEKRGFQAIGTSSAAIACLLGYEDGEHLSFDELRYMTERIALSSTLPLSVDIESGYGAEPDMIVNNIKQLSKLGAVGINIEDSVVGAERTLVDVRDFSKKLADIRRGLTHEHLDIFVNVRMDTYLTGSENPIEETLKRCAYYQQAGADGIFIPGMTAVDDIRRVVESTKLPINVMCMPGLPNFSALEKLGVRRISMGNFIFDKMYHEFDSTLHAILDIQSFEPIF